MTDQFINEVEIRGFLLKRPYIRCLKNNNKNVATLYVSTKPDHGGRLVHHRVECYHQETIDGPLKDSNRGDIVHLKGRLLYVFPHMAAIIVLDTFKPFIELYPSLNSSPQS